MSDFKNLKLNTNNPRTISKVKYEKLLKSIETFTKMLELRPIIYDENDVIWGGNMRYTALMQLHNDGKVELKPEYFKKIEGYTEEEKKEFAIRDNVELGDWDMDILANEWSDLPLDDWGIDTKGWEKEVEEDEAPEVSQEEPKSKLGEIYQLGRHRLMCGDSTKIEDVEKLMNGNKADMVFTDPPYGMGLDTDYTKIRPDTEAARRFQEAKGETTNKRYRPVIGDDEEWIFDKANHFDCAEQFWWGADWYRRTLPAGGSWFVWDKRTNDDGSNLDDMFGSCFELCWSKTRHKREIARIKYASLFGTEREDVKQRLHPTQKPVLLASWFLSRFSKDGDKVVDLFGGSGSTLIACEQLNRTCYMMELDPKYCDVIRKRYWQFVNSSLDGWEENTPALM